MATRFGLVDHLGSPPFRKSAARIHVADAKRSSGNGPSRSYQRRAATCQADRNPRARPASRPCSPPAACAPSRWGGAAPDHPKKPAESAAPTIRPPTRQSARRQDLMLPVRRMLGSTRRACLRSPPVTPEPPAAAASASTRLTGQQLPDVRGRYAPTTGECDLAGRDMPRASNKLRPLGTFMRMMPNANKSGANITGPRLLRHGAAPGQPRLSRRALLPRRPIAIPRISCARAARRRCRFSAVR